MTNDIEIIRKTQRWISGFVIRYDICPFASRPFNDDKIKYVVAYGSMPEVLESVQKEIGVLEKDNEIETTLIILKDGFNQFDDYLDLIDLSQALIVDLKVEGVFQLASFHPKYQFEGEDKDAVSNMTNRSPYPMLHLLREDSVYHARQHFQEIESISQKNIQVLTEMSKKAINEIINL